jgi:hypothetical protein
MTAGYTSVCETERPQLRACHRAHQRQVRRDELAEAVRERIDGDRRRCRREPPRPRPRSAQRRQGAPGTTRGLAPWRPREVNFPRNGRRRRRPALLDYSRASETLTAVMARSCQRSKIARSVHASIRASSSLLSVSCRRANTPSSPTTDRVAGAAMAAGLPPIRRSSTSPNPARRSGSPTSSR